MENQPQIIVTQKSMGVTILLTIFFGPLGMFYSTIVGGIIMLILSGIVAVFTLGIGLFITWPICIIWAAVATNSYNKKLLNWLLFVVIIFTFYSCQNNSEKVAKIDTVETKIDRASNSQKQNNNINKTTETIQAGTNCDGNKRAYEFGREMATMVKLGSSSLKNAIKESFEPIGIEPPFNSSNPCVIKGFEDESNNIPSPYNKDGRSWEKFN